ncbi:MAG: hypothetical protein IH965_12570 [Gemmatimonadetes bacterium]|nr:hypothetical protein [Gemmatimonadota bacterium]
MEQIAELCGEVDVPTKIFDLLIALTRDPLGANQLVGVWPQVTLAVRGIPVHELASIHNVVLLKWKDGAVTPLSSFVPAELASQNGVLTDGSVCTLIQVGANNLSRMVLESSLDTLHDHRSQQADDEAYEILMGLIVLVLQGHRIVDPGGGVDRHMAPQYVNRCQNVMRLLQAMFRPPIAPQVKQQIAAIQSQQQRDKDAAGNSEVYGGWD